VDDKFIPVTALAITLCHYGEILAVGNFGGTVAIFSTSVMQSGPVSSHLVISFINVLSVIFNLLCADHNVQW
jgi:hypothetical protein